MSVYSALQLLQCCSLFLWAMKPEKYLYIYIYIYKYI